MRISKKLKWTLITVGGLLLIFGGYVYFLGTRALLEQAESFAFRRMVVPQLDEEGTYQFFYATNRILADPQAPTETRFDSQRSETITFGSFDTSLEQTLGLGMLIDPSEWFLNEEIQLSNVVDLEREDMLMALKEQVANSPRRSLLVVVHGFRERFPSALRKTAFLAHVLDINTPVLVFDWPGDQGSSLRGYRRARGIARESAAELAKVLKRVVNEVAPDRIWMLANSMGAQVVVNSFDVLHEDPDFADPEYEFENVILTAPDVGHQDFNERFREESWGSRKIRQSTFLPMTEPYWPADWSTLVPGWGKYAGSGQSGTCEANL